jgi:two-component system, NarL family, response regulator NreC
LVQELQSAGSNPLSVIECVADVSAMKMIAILVVSDELIARTGLRHLLASVPGFKVVGEAATDDAEQHMKNLNPDVIVLHAADRDSTELVRLVRRAADQAAIVLIGREIRAGHLGLLLAAGALGYVQVQTGAQELFGAIRAASRRQRFIDPSLSDELFELFIRHGAAGARQLSPREQQVLRMLAFGHTLKEIANQLKVSQKSIETYRSRIREKLDLRTRADIVRYALDAGILAVPNKKAS